MLSSTDTPRVYLACGATDLRKSIDGLAAIVTNSFRLDAFTGSLFVFCNRGRDNTRTRVPEILYWDNNGFWLYYRRLERGRFRWPASSDPCVPLSMTRRQLQWLLDGLPIEQRQAHAPVTARIAA